MLIRVLLSRPESVSQQGDWVLLPHTYVPWLAWNLSLAERAFRPSDCHFLRGPSKGYAQKRLICKRCAREVYVCVCVCVCVCEGVLVVHVWVRRARPSAEPKLQTAPLHTLGGRGESWAEARRSRRP